MSTTTKTTQCENCGETYAASELKPLGDIRGEIEPGVPYPAGRCPTCDTLAYLLDEHYPAHLRHLVARSFEVVAYVSGGNCTGARARAINRRPGGEASVSMEVFDVDNLKSEGKTSDEVNALWDEIEKSHPQPIC